MSHDWKTERDTIYPIDIKTAAAKKRSTLVSSVDARAALIGTWARDPRIRLTWPPCVFSSSTNMQRVNVLLAHLAPAAVAIHAAPTAAHLANIPTAAPDAVFLTKALYMADKDERKVDLGIGAYRTEEGKPLVLKVVKKVRGGKREQQMRGVWEAGISTFLFFWHWAGGAAGGECQPQQGVLAHCRRARVSFGCRQVDVWRGQQGHQGGSCTFLDSESSISRH